jgi:hypothetical protein
LIRFSHFGTSSSFARRQETWGACRYDSSPLSGFVPENADVDCFGFSIDGKLENTTLV